MIERFLLWCRVPRFDITGCDAYGPQMGKHSLYLRRFKFLKTTRLSVYLHFFHRSDDARALHDHPWPFMVMILWGGYWEHTERGKEWMRPGRIFRRPAEWRHRVELGSKRAVSLVLVGPRVRDWGLWVAGRWVQWQEYGRRFGCGDGE